MYLLFPSQNRSIHFIHIYVTLYYFREPRLFQDVFGARQLSEIHSGGLASRIMLIKFYSCKNHENLLRHSDIVSFNLLI